MSEQMVPFSTRFNKVGNMLALCSTMVRHASSDGEMTLDLSTSEALGDTLNAAWDLLSELSDHDIDAMLAREQQARAAMYTPEVLAAQNAQEARILLREAEKMREKAQAMLAEAECVMNGNEDGQEVEHA